MIKCRKSLACELWTISSSSLVLRRSPRAWSSFSLSPQVLSLYEWKQWGSYLFPASTFWLLNMALHAVSWIKTWRAQYTLHDLLWYYCVSVLSCWFPTLLGLYHTHTHMSWYCIIILYTYAELCNWRLEWETNAAKYCSSAQYAFKLSIIKAKEGASVVPFLQPEFLHE